MVKEFLSREGYRFTVKNVEDDDAAYEALLDLGFRAVPVTIVNGHRIAGFNEPALRAALAAWQS
jgi:glutaredoxin